MANYSDYGVVEYIRLDSGAVGWWTKPYWPTPVTPIAGDGTWSCDVTAGDADQDAVQITAFLIPSTYSPPLAGGEASLPGELYAYLYANVDRAP